MICFYHKSDFDGILSGVIVKYFNEECELHGIEYDDDFPFDLVRDREVILVDYCIQPPSEMLKLKDFAKRVVWIDHHKRAIDEVNSLTKEQGFYFLGKRDDKFASCELAWKYYSKLEEYIPITVRMIGRYDVWDHSNPDVLKFQFGMRARNPDVNDFIWLKGLDDDLEIEPIIQDGKAIQKYIKSSDKRKVDLFSFRRIFEGHRTICLNTEISSYTFNSKRNYDIMLGFTYTGEQWKVSLRTNEDNIDVSKIAKKYGGGGHPKASGFYIKDINLVIK